MIRPRPIPLLLALALGGILVAGAKPESSPEPRLGLRAFTDRSGLPQNAIPALALDTQGYLWVGTFDGLARFNGREWTTFPAPDRRYANWVNQGAMTVASDGTVWVGTRYTGAHGWKDGRWTHLGTATGLPSDNVNAILEAPGSPGTLWFGTFGGGVARWTPGGWAHYGTDQGLPSTRVFALAEGPGPDGKPRIWAGTDHGLAWFRGDRWVPFEGNVRLGDIRIRCLARTRDEDGGATLWIGTENGGLAAWKDGRLRLFRRTEAEGEGLASDAVLALLATPTREGRSDGLWVGTQGGGLARWEDGRWRTYGRRNGLPTGLVRSLAEVRVEGGIRMLYVGTDGKGVLRFPLQGWRSAIPSWMEDDPRVYCFAEAPGSAKEPQVWLGGATWGLARFEPRPGNPEGGGTWRRWDLPELMQAGVRALHAFPGPGGREDLWVATGGKGLAHLEGNRWSWVRAGQGIPSDTVRALGGRVRPDGRKELWVGTSRGVAAWDGGSWRSWMPQDGLVHESVRCLQVEPLPSGGTRVWVGTDGGLGVWQDGTWRRVTVESGLGSNNVSALLVEPRGAGSTLVWVGTYGGGLAWVEPDTLKVHALKDQSPPLRGDETVTSLALDGRGRVLVGTGRGLLRVDRRNEGFAATSFTTEDGLPGLECLGGSLFADRGGRAWVGTVDGPAFLDPAWDPPDRGFAELCLERAWAARAEGGQPGAFRPGDSLEGAGNRIQFEYALLTHHREPDIRYQTQLLGFDAQPTAWVRDGKREFTNLHRGRYTFLVWGLDPSGAKVGPVRFAFTVRPAPWESWWALLLYALGLAGLVHLLVRWRLRVLEARNAALEARVEERTAEVRRQKEELELLNEDLQRLNQQKSEFMGVAAHDLKNPLSGITLTAELILGEEDLEPAEFRTQVARIARASQQMSELVSRILSAESLDAGHLRLSPVDLDAAPWLKDLADAHRPAAAAKGQTLELEVPEGLRVHADPQFLKEVLDNLLSNAVKYSPKGGAIRLEAAPDEPGRVRFRVSDQGPGFSAEDQLHLFKRYFRLSAKPTAGEGSTGLGLSIVKKLTEAMGGTIHLESEPGKGSTFVLDLPGSGRS